MKKNIANFSNMERRAKILQAEDGYSLFTWSDFGGTIGLVQWRERHGLDWVNAHKAATEWVNTPEK